MKKRIRKRPGRVIFMQSSKKILNRARVVSSEEIINLIGECSEVGVHVGAHGIPPLEDMMGRWMSRVAEVCNKERIYIFGGLDGRRINDVVILVSETGATFIAN